MSGRTPSAPRCAAIVGSYLSGKTTLLESLLFACGAIHRKGTVKDGNTVGDASPEARARNMSIEVTAAAAEFLGEQWHFLDCPGSVEFSQDTYTALMVADVAVVVCEPEASRALTLAPLFHFLDLHNIPHMVFINKMDTANDRVREVLEALQSVSDRTLALRHVPIRDGDQITGYVDLASERAYQYKPGQASSLIEVPEGAQDRNESARQELLETLADFDDALLEQLLEDVVPPKDEIYQHLTRELQETRIVPVFLGAAEQDHGVRRLMKALRHETPGPEQTLERLGGADGDPLVQVFKTYHLAHTGKLSVARIWRGSVEDGMSFGEHRVSGLSQMKGHTLDKITKAYAGDVVGLGRLEAIKSGDVLTAEGVSSKGLSWLDPLPPVFSAAIAAEKREDEVKLSTGIARVVEEDPSIVVEHNDDTHELVLWGQGDIHLQVVADKLRDRYNVAVTMKRPQVPYKETIRKPIQQHARHKKQSGGHGEFGDVHLEIKPVARGAGFEFIDKISGGVVPRQYIPAVEHGVKEYMTEGPLGFPVIDISVTLYDGQHHSVDSSDMAFRRAGILAMKDGLPQCEPVLLEPIATVSISVPSEFTGQAQSVISKRRGQILGFDAKAGWGGWDEVKAHMPQSELHDLIVDLRSLTLGVGTFEWNFDHLSEITGRDAEMIVAHRKEAAE
ncbi:MAG: elongation factor G [Alphaproteobacteria bacterium]|nr:elongation factor G [Alphaproteobacteria bacterium]